MSFFITFEGIEGCGKTTQIHLLKTYLEKQGYKVIVTREPGGTPIGDKIRSILLDSSNSAICTKTELLLYQAARAQHTNDVLLPSLREGYIVLCDRFTDATLAYQGYAQTIDSDFIRTLNEYTTDNLVPDLTILIDCPVEIGLKRALNRSAAKPKGISEDRFEEKSISFHQAVRLGYLSLAESNGDRFFIVDGREDIPTIHQEIKSTVLSRLETNSS